MHALQHSSEIINQYINRNRKWFIYFSSERGHQGAVFLILLHGDGASTRWNDSSGRVSLARGPGDAASKARRPQLSSPPQAACMSPAPSVLVPSLVHEPKTFLRVELTPDVFVVFVLTDTPWQNVLLLDVTMCVCLWSSELMYTMCRAAGGLAPGGRARRAVHDMYEYFGCGAPTPSALKHTKAKFVADGGPVRVSLGVLDVGNSGNHFT